MKRARGRMPGARGRLGALVALTLCLAAMPSVALAASRVKVIERSIDAGSGSGSLSNTLEEDYPQVQGHPHEALGKPSKFDLNVGQYVETSDEDLLAAERIGTTKFRGVPPLKLESPVSAAGIGQSFYCLF
jgi:hypothetical protein